MLELNSRLYQCFVRKLAVISLAYVDKLSPCLLAVQTKHLEFTEMSTKRNDIKIQVFFLMRPISNFTTPQWNNVFDYIHSHLGDCLHDTEAAVCVSVTTKATTLTATTDYDCIRTSQNTRGGLWLKNIIDRYELYESVQSPRTNNKALVLKASKWSADKQRLLPMHETPVHLPQAMAEPTFTNQSCFPFLQLCFSPLPWLLNDSLRGGGNVNGTGY